MIPLDPAIVIWLAFVVGLCVGSFLNVLGLRLLCDESILSPPSHCPSCQRPLTWLENIPVVSYVLQGGQCRGCKTSIHWQYPVVELVTALLFAVVAWQFGASWATLWLWFLLANLVAVCITDFRESLIFHINVLPLIPVGFLGNAFDVAQLSTTLNLAPWQVLGFELPGILASSLLAVLVPVAIFEGCILLSRWIFKTDGFGHGDTLLMVGIGAYFGWQLALLGIVLGFIVQAIPAIPLLAWQWIKHKHYDTLLSGTVALLGALVPVALMVWHIGSLDFQWWATIISAVVALVAVVFFLRCVRARESYTYLPFGPALVVGSLVALFFGAPILGQLF
jgi:leader peptidase (prepilin peptidase)/N-methyltransferase